MNAAIAKACGQAAGRQRGSYDARQTGRRPSGSAQDEEMQRSRRMDGAHITVATVVAYDAAYMKAYGASFEAAKWLEDEAVRRIERRICG